MALSDCMQKSSFSKRINNAYRNCLWSWVAKVAYLSLLISLGATHRAGPNDFKMQPDVGRSEKLNEFDLGEKVVVLNFLLSLNLPKKISHGIKNRQPDNFLLFTYNLYV